MPAYSSLDSGGRKLKETFKKTPKKDLLAFRRMRHAHVSDVARIEHQTFRPGWPFTAFHTLIDEGYDCWIVDSGKRIEGYGIVQVQADIAHILNFCVQKESRGKGWGRWLLDRMLSMASRRARFAMLEVRKSNYIAINLYRSLGFEEHSVRPDYYPTQEGTEDALVLARPLL